MTVAYADYHDFLIRNSPSFQFNLNGNQSTFNMSKLIRQIVTTSKLGKPLGPYSTAVIADRTVYISGCLGIDAETGKMVAGGVAAEAKQALVNMGIVLESADSCFDRVVKCTVFLNDMNDFAAVNEEYKKGEQNI